MFKSKVPQPMSVLQAILASQLTNSYNTNAVFVPRAHLKALKLDVPLVAGPVGVGKSFYTHVLASDNIRPTLLPELANFRVQTGPYPSVQAFKEHLSKGGDAFELWKACVVRWVARESQVEIPHERWHDTVEWMRTNPDAVEALMQQRRDWKGLIVFDEIDRVSTSWEHLNQIVRGLMQTVVWLRKYPNLYAKVFLRNDLVKTSSFNFEGGTMLLARAVNLAWYEHDLHGLLWHKLINAPDHHGEIMRVICPHNKNKDMYQVSDAAQRDKDVQRALFAQLADKRITYKGRKAHPYDLLNNLLIDSRYNLYPAQFLHAIQYAAEHAATFHIGHEYALPVDSILHGVEYAVKIRLHEIEDEFPWVIETLAILKDMYLPRKTEEIIARLEARYPNGPESVFVGCLPTKYAELTGHGPWNSPWHGVLKQLSELGLIHLTESGKVDLPNIYYHKYFNIVKQGAVR